MSPAPPSVVETTPTPRPPPSKACKSNARWRWRGVLKQPSNKITAWATLAIALLTLFAGILAYRQYLTASRLSISANIYNLEKDFKDLFDRLAASSEFGKCFAPSAEGAASSAPRKCWERKAVDEFTDLVVFYRMVADLEKYGALPIEYVSERMDRFCKIARTSRGRYALQELHDENRFQAEFRNTLQRRCNIEVR